MNEDTYRDKLNDLQVEVEALRAKLKEAQTGDTISRQAAINLLKKWSDGYAYIETETELAIKEFQELPSAQPEQRWIPCSERLPKPFEHCLWTTTDGRVVYHHCDGLFSNYTAWMPLPEPYKERWEE